MTSSTGVTDPAVEVLIVSAYADPHVGGVEVVVAQQARTLAELGHRVTVITSRCGAGHTRQEQVDGYTVLRVAAWNGLEERGGVPFPVWSPAAMWRIARLAGRADVVHVHDVYHGSSILAAAAARLRRRPLFVTQHVGIVAHDRTTVQLAQLLAYASAGRLLWSWATSITAYNQIVCGFLRRYGVPANKVQLACNGIDTRHFCPGEPGQVRATRQRHGLSPDAPVVLFVGRLVPKKGFQELLGACGPEYQVALAGPGKIPGHVPDGARFLGPVTRQELRDLYQAADIFALPAVGEVMTLAMQEAMACGLPVVTTNEEAYGGYDLDPRGVALIPAQAGALRAAFIDILGDPDRRRHMQAYSRRLAQERFDWRKNSAQVAASYGLALCARPAPRPARPAPRWRALRWRALRWRALRWRALRWAAAAIAGVALGISLLLPAGRHQWALSLIRQPAPYTVLAFSQPAALPAVIRRQAAITVSFTVGNHEGQPVSYQYVLRARSRRGSRVLATSRHTVAAGASWPVSAVIRPACGSSRCHIEITLPGHPERIDFLVRLTAGTPRHA